jgi:hypothetical protein
MTEECVLQRLLVVREALAQARYDGRAMVADLRMSGRFRLLDLPSQAPAVQRLLSGQSEAEKLAWLGAHGRLVPIQRHVPSPRQIYSFESWLGFQCLFFIDGDEFVFMGDHTTYTVTD